MAIPALAPLPDLAEDPAPAVAADEEATLNHLDAAVREHAARKGKKRSHPDSEELAEGALQSKVRVHAVTSKLAAAVYPTVGEPGWATSLRADLRAQLTDLRHHLYARIL